MEGFTGSYTKNGLPIYTYEHVQKRRDMFFSKKSLDYIAQPGGQEDALKVDADIVIAGGNRGGGKAHTYDTLVITPSGMRRMGDLEVGDPVLTPYEGVQTVENIFEQGEQTTYTVHFSDGTKTEVMDEHRFWVREKKTGPFSVMTLNQIRQRYRLGQEYPNSLRPPYENYAEIPLCGEIKFRQRQGIFQMPIHPYALGVITADGYLNIWRGQACVAGYHHDAQRRIRDLGFTWHFFKDTGKNLIAGFTKEQILEVNGHRYGSNIPFRIPDIIRYADPEVRWEYIRGVFDLESTFWRDYPSIKSTNQKWLEDLAWVIRSLGCFARIERTNEKDVFVVKVRTPNDKELYSSGVKKDWAWVNADKATSPDQEDVLVKSIFHIKKSKRKKKCRCIQVSGNDHLYLTDAFTISHNTVMLLMNPLYNTINPKLNGIILRKEKGDLDNIIRESALMYSEMGDYKSSMFRWDMHTGAKILFSYFTGNYDDFKDRIQGRQYAYIGIDEITQMEWDKFKYLITANRNGAHIRNRLIGTCNPDPGSWVAKFIDWWIGDDGYPISERNGKIRYCFMGGDTPEEIVWGNTRLECYEKIKDKIDGLVDERDVLPPEQMYIKSVAFVRAELDDNRALLESSPEYKANLAQQSEEQRERDFKGNWKFMEMGDDLIKMIHLQRCFENPEMTGDRVRRVSCDVAFTGGDACVMWLWEGWHVRDVFVCRLDSQATVGAISAKLLEWNVHEENMVYDMQGVGQVIKGFFKRAVPFSNQETVRKEYKGMYDTEKSRCAFTFADRIIRGEISFEPSLLERRFSGKGFKNLELGKILMEERKIIRADQRKSDKGKCLISKDQMKSIIHRSPDFMESLFMREALEKRHVKTETPSWIKRSVRTGFLAKRKLS